jgi:hypothetical protein
MTGPIVASSPPHAQRGGARRWLVGRLPVPEDLVAGPLSTWPGMARLRSTSPASCEAWPTRHWTRPGALRLAGLGLHLVR